ncbi:MAG: PDDEXK nuclease domain-containing protein [Capsulimonas sp.]|uniref:PDDEXK nuclease domain-containing protein n=1 Tax=Capsulimonas sp. TaxID=2494211 RepID=UPI003267B19E
MKKPEPTPIVSLEIADDGLGPLVAQVRSLLQSARRTAAVSINSLQVRTNYEIGRLIVEHEQQGHQRAAYGQALVKELARRLTTEVGRGYSYQSLYVMRNFYLAYRTSIQAIFQTPSGILPNNLPAEVFTLSWSHYVLLIGVRDENERRFYEIEAGRNSWSLRELQRQVGSGLYERLALSRDKVRAQQLANEGQIVATPADIIKDPYVLEFLGLDISPGYSESDLESAIISKLEHFLLELGKGFLFEGRQKRFTFDEDHFYVDLVFYNRLLRCYVLIDLKLDQLTHQDLGQMQMYVNYFDRYVKAPEENPTVGIVLCRRKKDALVELTLPKDANIFAAAYQLYLPTKEDLRSRLMEWIEESGDAGEASPD